MWLKLTFLSIDVVQEVNGVFYHTVTDITVIPERQGHSQSELDNRDTKDPQWYPSSEWCQYHNIKWFIIPAHFSLRSGLSDDNGLPQFGFQIHLVVTVSQELPLDRRSNFPWETRGPNFQLTAILSQVIHLIVLQVSQSSMLMCNVVQLKHALLPEVHWWRVFFLMRTDIYHKLNVTTLTISLLFLSLLCQSFLSKIFKLIFVPLATEVILTWLKPRKEKQFKDK